MKKFKLSIMILVYSIQLLANSNIDIPFVHFVEKVSQQNNINIYIDEDIKDKTVSLFIPEKISNNNLMKLFKSTVSKMDYNLKKSGNNYYLKKKVPFDKQNYLYKLKYNSKNDCIAVLNVLKTKYIYLDDSNTLLLSATKNDYKVALSFLKQVDTKQKQVILKIMVYEFQNNDISELGVQYSTLIRDLNGVSTTVFNSLVVPFSNSGSTIKSTDFFGFIKFLEQKKAIKIKQYPYVLAKNNKPFKFEAVENVPYLINTTTTEASNTSQQTSVEYKDVGLKINGKAFIYSDYITLDLDLIVEDLTNSGSDSTATPQTFKRHLNSNTNIEYNKVLLLSGIKRTKEDTSVIGIPILSKIPYLGQMFRFNYDSEEEINITIAIEVLKPNEKSKDILNPFIIPLKPIKELYEPYQADEDEDFFWFFL